MSEPKEKLFWYVHNITEVAERAEMMTREESYRRNEELQKNGTPYQWIANVVDVVPGSTERSYHYGMTEEERKLKG